MAEVAVRLRFVGQRWLDIEAEFLKMRARVEIVEPSLQVASLRAVAPIRKSGELVGVV